MTNSLFDLSNKVVLITGAAGGIGSAITHAFAQSGAKLILADRALVAIEGLVETMPEHQQDVLAIEIEVQFREQCAAAVERAVERFGRVDVLINSAGVNTRMRPEKYSEDVWDDIVDINLKGTFNMCQAVFEPMSAHGGKIINIGSILSLVSNAMTAPYSASKGGVLQLTKSLACAWAENNIAVNAILPGWIDTKLSRQARIDIPGHAERVVETTPMQRWGTPEDLVGAAIFLSSSASNFVTGTSILVDGGVTAHV